MLCRFHELREASGADIVEKPSDEPAREEDEADVDWREFMEEMGDLYKEILEDEGVTEQACEEVRQRVNNMDEIVQLEREALLPGKLSQLASRFESQEMVCQRMIRRAKEMLTTLKAEDQDYDEDDVAHIAIRQVRTSIARVRALEFKSLVQGFFAARSHNRQEMIMRASRQLRFAYPDALEEEVSEIMEFPELALVAISRRLEKGSEVTLDGILGEMEGKKADARKLEQGAKELKLMFLQFEELIDTQGENLTSIEANIKTVIEETTDAIGVLQDAEEQKRAYERKKYKLYICCALVLICCICYPMFFREDGSFMVGPRGGLSLSKFTFRGCFDWAWRSTFIAIAPQHYQSLYGKEGASLVQVGHTSARRTSRHRLQGQETHRLSPDMPLRRHPVRGFVGRRAPLLQDEVMRSVALTARGGAASRKHRRGAQPANSTGS